MNVVAVVGPRWIARSARLGAPSVTLWLLAWALFFLPMAAAIIELSSRHPDQGGLYAWTRRAFGPVHGFICGWCVWVNNLFYFPSLLLFVAANLLVAAGPQAAHLADSRSYSFCARIMASRPRSPTSPSTMIADATNNSSQWTSRRLNRGCGFVFGTRPHITTTVAKVQE